MTPHDWQDLGPEPADPRLTLYRCPRCRTEVACDAGDIEFVVQNSQHVLPDCDEMLARVVHQM